MTPMQSAVRIAREKINWDLAGVGIALGLIILAVWPGNFVPDFGHDDAILHFVAGISLVCMIAAVVPERDDVILVGVGIVGLLFEPGEAVYFGIRTLPELIEWMTSEDTLFDIALVYAGAATALIWLKRYR